MSNEGYDSDHQGDKPRDDFKFYSTVFKVEEKKIVNHARWEQVTAVYWQLLRTMPEQDSTKNTISQKQYTLLLKRIYKVLLPLYRESEIESELAHEWLLDSHGQAEITQVVLGKILFRVAHWWSTNIDIDEYVDLLQRVHSRITFKSVYDVRTESQSDFLPKIQVSFPLEEKKINETVVRGAESQIPDNDWLECASNESNKSDFEYKYEEDPEKMVVKKLKKKKAAGFDMMANAAVLTIKDPFIYNEEVLYPELSDPRQTDLNYRSVEDKFLDMKQILPFGYPSEQFLRQIKQDVHNKIEDVRRNKKNNRQNNDDDEDQSTIPDSGLISSENGIFLEFPITAWSFSGQSIFARVTDTLYNNYRKLLREGVLMTLRFYSQFPKSGGRGRARSSASKDEPNLELNKFGYNPSLDRRLSYKYLPVASKSNEHQFINVNYLIADPDFETAYRSDVQRIETKGKMAIKDSDDIKREEEFVNVETTYRKMRQVMLQKKFETLFRDRAAAEQADQRRWQGVVDGVEKEKRSVLKHAPISQKGLRETYEEKSFVKMMRGPFCSLESREGPQEDDFYTCSDMDLINAARSQSLRLLVIGKPRSGKTKLAKNLATRLDLVHISVENWLATLQKKIKDYAPPEDLEEGQAPPKYLSDLEDAVNKSLLAGSGPNDDQLLQIVKLMIHSPQAVLKGFVLDLSFYEREGSDQSWAGLIRQLKLLGETSTQKAVEFTQIIELWMEDDDIRLRAQNMRVDPADGALYSRWEREERKKPKPKKEGEEDDAPVDEENIIKPLVEKDLIQRVNDTEDRIRVELTHYSSVERPAMEELLINFYEDQFIRLEAAGLTPDELADTVQCRLKQEEGLPLRPLPIQIEGASEDAYLQLLTEGLPEKNLPRKWSLWKQYDPVALLNGKLIKGKADFACHYSGNVFVFSSEDNFKAFMQEPKKYLLEKPKMPEIFRVLMLGPRGAGKHTQAKHLSETYGWKIVDFKELVRSTLEELMKQEAHIPNNPTPGGRIGLSELELNEIIEGKQFPAWKFIPWILNYLGCPLEKKRPPPPEEKPEGEAAVEEEVDEETKKKRDQEAKKKAQEEEKKRKEEEEKNHAKEERRAKRQQARDQGLDPRDLGIEDSEEEPIIIEDLSIDQLVIKTDELTGKPHFVGGFILVGFPETLEQMEKLKAHGIQFDKIINLRDMSPLPEESDEPAENMKEQEPGTEIKARMANIEFYDYDAEVELASKVYGQAGESLGAELGCEIHCNGSSDSVHIRVRKEIDPFFLKKDDPSVCKVTDLEGYKGIPKGDFGEYCPITYVDDGWLVRGSAENEVIVNGKSYWFADPKEAKRFSFNPSVYLKTLNGKATIPIQPPKPKIMIFGNRGAGTTTMINMLCEKFKLEDFLLKEKFVKKQNEEKEKRKRARLLNKGFAPPSGFDEETGKPIPDPDVENEPDGFNQEDNDIEIMRSLMDASKGLIIDGSWRKMTEEDKMDPEAFEKLLVGSRRVPEIVIILRCSEESTHQRLIEFDVIRAEFDRLMAIRAAERAKVRAEERQKEEEKLRGEAAEKVESGEVVDVDALLAEWDQNRDTEEKAADEGDSEGKPNLEEMINVKKTALTEQRAEEDAFFDDLSTRFKERQVFVIDDIKSDWKPEYVMVKILDRIKDNLQFRKDMIERQLTYSLQPEEVNFYEKSYQFKYSKFGPNSSLSLSNPAKSKKNTAVYRERIYFFSNQEEKQKFLKQPSKYTQEVRTIPLDVPIKPKVFVIGLPKSGKSTLCKLMTEKIGLVHLKMNKIIQQFITQDSAQGEYLRKQMMAEGRQLEDDMMVSLLIKRIQMKDCQSNGWVLEDFPKTRNQALFMAKRGITPTNVFLMKQTNEETFKRTHSKADQKFNCNRTIVAGRIKFFMEHLPHVVSFYQRLYNSLVEIDSNKSKWFIEDRAIGEIQRNIEARQNFTSDYYSQDQGQPVKMRDLHMDRCLVKQSLSEFRYYCPVTWKNEKLLVKCAENFEDCVLYNNSFYFFKSIKERDMFISDLPRFTHEINFPRNSELAQRAQLHKASEIILHEKSLSGHCAVSLVDEDRVRKGDPVLLIHFKDDKYVFDSEFKLQRFLANPFKYSKATLPVKMPPPEDKVSLYNLQKMEDSISFMEQALGQIVTKGLREVSENRLKYPTLSLKETMLKLFALFLKTENPANTESMKRKYAAKMKQFIQRCELPEEIYDLAMEKDKKKSKGQWPQFKENYYNDKGAEYDSILKLIEHERLENFINYIR